MADNQIKPEIFGWIRTIILIVAISIATGKILGDVQSNTKAIQANTEAIQKNSERIANVELRKAASDNEIKHIKETLDEVRCDVKKLLSK